MWDYLPLSGWLTHFFVTTVTCIDPSCYGNGLCHLGKCVCYKGFKGDHCQLPDKLNLTHLCARNCSGHGQFDWDMGQCICHRFFTGQDCEQGKGCCLKFVTDPVFCCHEKFWPVSDCFRCPHLTLELTFLACTECVSDTQLTSNKLTWYWPHGGIEGIHNSLCMVFKLFLQSHGVLLFPYKSPLTFVFLNNFCVWVTKLLVAVLT